MKDRLNQITFLQIRLFSRFLSCHNVLEVNKSIYTNSSRLLKSIKDIKGSRIQDILSPLLVCAFDDPYMDDLRNPGVPRTPLNYHVHVQT